MENGAGSAFFHFIPNAVEFLKRGTRDFASAGLEFSLEGLEAANEAVRGSVEGRLGIDAELAGEIDGGEKQVSDLGFGRGGVRGLDRFPYFSGFLCHLGKDGFRIRPVKSHAADFLLGILSTKESR